MFWDTAVAQDPLTDLMENPDTTTEDLLNENSLMVELRHHNPELITYLLQDKFVQGLCKWSIFYSDCPNYDRLSRIATDILITSREFSKQLSQSPVMNSNLKQFLENSNEWDNGCCGHFQRIFLNLISVSEDFYPKYEGYIDSLIKHADLFAVSTLLIQLVTTHHLSQEKIITQLASNCETLNMATALYQIYTADQSSRSYYSNVIPIIQQKIDTATNELIAIELERLAYEIKKNTSETISIAIPQGKPTARQAFAQACLISNPADAIMALFQKPLHWGIANKALAIISEMDKPNLLSYVSADGLIKKLGKACKGKLNPQQYMLIKLINDLDGMEGFDSNAWKSSIPQSVIDHANKIGKQFGGEVPIATAPIDLHAIEIG